ncbi:probable serine/threonine-protein kinase PBL7 isoform X2 [Papaver somniferum]|uniref:probable serine/threonine-protein kinase PBL7 isoform X2 n=1 Tax=Papaver somniferum TaxID=3469 RepID=UPI000E70018E|nr:probable serine/threonine-protein kinase PBL7 isoform X2 [Papaver somniferum]
MPRFRFFSCLGFSKVQRSHSERRDDRDEAEQAEFQNGRVFGEGSSGRVYKGILKDGQEVAVKRFDRQENLGKEVQILSCLEHPNLVKMIGYCDEGKDHIIVYEFVPLRSLNLHLHDLKPGEKHLDWKTRMKIAEGVAKALKYLHDQNDPPIIHSDLKGSGILLDENYNPKLSEFICAEYDATWDNTMINLTCGYLDPEYTMTGRITNKSDVYSFGVVLLELICGKKAFDPTIRRSIVSWARPLLEDSKKFAEIADPLMKGQYPHRALVQALDLVKLCLQEDANERPLAAEVVITLTNIRKSIWYNRS